LPTPSPRCANTTDPANSANSESRRLEADVDLGLEGGAVAVDAAETHPDRTSRLAADRLGIGERIRLDLSLSTLRLACLVPRPLAFRPAFGFRLSALKCLCEVNNPGLWPRQHFCIGAGSRGEEDSFPLTKDVSRRRSPARCGQGWRASPWSDHTRAPAAVIP